MHGIATPSERRNEPHRQPAMFASSPSAIRVRLTNIATVGVTNMVFDDRNTVLLISPFIVGFIASFLAPLFQKLWDIGFMEGFGLGLLAGVLLVIAIVVLNCKLRKED